VDPWFLVETAPELTPLIYHARQVNDEQPHFVVRKIEQVLGPLKDRKIAALGLAYKPDVDDLRESPAIEVVHLLQKEGAQVKAWEPFKPEAKLNGIDMATSFEGAIEGAELVLLLVKHSEFVNLKPEEVALKTQARVLIDCVNGWIAAPWENAGFTVFRLGVNNAKIISQPSQI
jgi:UDP-N-acetyl-D-mannosaminuronic acid dehydrogenase